jgi:prepilin-type N-terminal cleavage/methylation domain-containing protein
MNERGFGLLETVIAMSILAMALTSAVQLHYMTSKCNMRANVITMVHMAAKDEIETIRGKDVLNLTEGTFYKNVGVVRLETTITKMTPRFGRVVIMGTAPGRSIKVRFETYINNLHGSVGG